MTAPGVTPTPIRLFEGETILASGRAMPSLAPRRQIEVSVLFLCTVVLLPLLPLAWWANTEAVRQHRWWLTDRRLVVANGIVGRSVRSVPLDKIVDVTVTSTWWDKLWGMEHVNVRDQTGEVGAAGTATGLSLMAVEDAASVADQILASLPQATSDQDLVAALRQLIAA